ncbi:MAG TPA: hypothetical protein DEA08_07700 [Planctomycetes bacterium]|nr:hypothetical protein [Planctomycetota bacterium]|tara:strand:- start:256 stop:780 length:525 start_codon:yes stop_codon:yes gene_type:complete
MKPDRGELLGDFAQDEGHALEAMFRRTLNDPDLARDLAQETLLRAWSKRDDYDPSRPLRSWVFGIGINLLRNHLRRRKLEQATLQPLGDLPREGREETPTKRLAKAEREEQLEGAIRALPPSQQEVVLLRYQEGLSCQEIADVVGTTPNAVSIKLYHARKALRERLRDAAEETG